MVKVLPEEYRVAGGGNHGKPIEANEMKEDEEKLYQEDTSDGWERSYSYYCRAHSR